MMLWLTVAVVIGSGSGFPPPPLGLDLYMPVPDSNPLTRENVNLGQRLFNDTRLSRDGTVTCRSCHTRRVHSPPTVPCPPGCSAMRAAATPRL